MSSFDLKLETKELALKLGDSLVERLGKYLKDEADTEFLKEMALELAELQYQAATATTEELRDIAKEDIDFIHARIDTFVAGQAIKIKDEAKEIFNEVLQTVGTVVGVIAKTALTAAIG